MALEVIMPKAGVDMTEGQIVQWNKKVGEFVKRRRNPFGNHD